MKVTFSAPTQQDKAEYAFFASVLEGRTKVTATDESGNSAWLFIKAEDLQRLGKEYVESHLSLSYSQVFNGYHLSLSQNDYYNTTLNVQSSISNVEDVAGRLGLMKIDDSQITYIRLDDQSVLTRRESAVEKWTDTLEAGVSSLLRTINPPSSAAQ